MKRSALIVIVLLAATLAACGGRNSRQAAEGRAGIVFNLSDSLLRHRKADTLDFGRVREGERLRQDFAIRNDGDKPLVVTNMDVSCGCIAVDYPKEPLRPGEKQAISLALDTRGLGGWLYKTVAVETSLGTKPYMLIVIAEIVD